MRKNCSMAVLENFFEPCVLYLLMKKTGYGYDIQKQIKKHCNCEVNIGNLYRSLSRMQHQGYITREGAKSEIGPKRYSYTITDQGKAYLAEWIEALKMQNKIISLLIKNYQKNI